MIFKIVNNWSINYFMKCKLSIENQINFNFLFIQIDFKSKSTILKCPFCALFKRRGKYIKIDSLIIHNLHSWHSSTRVQHVAGMRKKNETFKIDDISQ